MCWELRTSGRLGFDYLWQGRGLGAPRQRGVEIVIAIMAAVVAATVSVVVTKRINVDWSHHMCQTLYEHYKDF